MVCIYCSGKTGVVNSRPQKKQNSIWRRRRCLACKAVFTSVETIDLGGSLMIRVDSNHSEPFQRDKLLLTIYDSLKHRKTATSDATALTNTVIGKLIRKNSDAVISKNLLTDTVLSILDKFDTVSAVHYRAYFG